MGEITMTAIPIPDELLIIIAASMAVTAVLVVATRFCWRRGKGLEEP
jgi:hypothetical protein